MTSYVALHILLIACALGGLSLTVFIHVKKHLRAPIICPLGHSCDPVVHSDYSRFMNIPVEILGMIYYAIIVSAYSTALALPAGEYTFLSALLLGLSGVAFAFSFYLTAIQMFILRQWCTWCLISAGLCAIIFFIGYRLANLPLRELLLLLRGA